MDYQLLMDLDGNININEMNEVDDGSGPSVNGARIEIYGSSGMDLESRGSIDAIAAAMEENEALGGDQNHDPLQVLMQAAPNPIVLTQPSINNNSELVSKNKHKKKKKRKTTYSAHDNTVNVQLPVKQKGKQQVPIAAEPSLEFEDKTDSDDTGEEDVPDDKDVKSAFKAAIWDHFICRIVRKRRRANCRYCGVKTKCHSKRNGTSSARSHFSSCTKNPFNNKSKSRQSVLNFTHVLPGTGGPSPYKGNWVFDVDAARDAFVKKVIVDGDPLCEYEKPGWNLIAAKALPPYFKLPKRSHLTRLCLKMYEKMKLNLKNLFATTKQRVSLTTDTWTSSNQRLTYMCVTAHYVDLNWKLEKKILNFVHVSSHKGEDLGLCLETCLRDEWGIEKVYCITMDNASCNDVLARSLRDNLNNWSTAVLDGDHIQMRCAAHIINLIVNEGLKENFESVSNVRGAVTYLRRSPMRLLVFKEACRKEKIIFKKHLWLDSPTRWNGAYIMLERALAYQAAFERYAKMDPQFCLDLQLMGVKVPSKADWENVGRLVEFLGHFCKVTKKVSGSWYMTSNLYLPEISDLFVKIKNLEKSTDVGVSSMAGRMLEKFDKYWGNPEKMNMNMFFAVILDPRHKFEVLNYILENIYGPEKSPMHSSLIKSEITRLFKAYLELSSTATSCNNRSSSTATTNDATQTGEPILRTMEFLRQQRLSNVSNPQRQRTELDKYLGEEVEDGGEKFDVLLWWKVNSARLPVLSSMARDVLAVPVTSVASESAFSTSGRVLSDFRSSLTPRTVEALMCAQDWLYPRGAPNPSVEEDFDSLVQIEEAEDVEEEEE